MRTPAATPSEFLTSFSRQRQLLLQRSGGALPGDGQTPVQNGESNVVITQCLMTSLEELKVAEEEMLQQQLQLLTSQAESERMITYWRTLFDLAPVPLMLTTTDGSIRASNQALASLLTRDVYHLEGKPLVALVSADLRVEFRSMLKRVVEVGGVTSWALTLERKTRDPIDVQATIQLVPSALTGTMALYWSLRAVDPAAV